jgi:hypothetical protein
LIKIERGRTMRFENILLITGFLLVFIGVFVLITSAFIPSLIKNHLIFYAVFLSMILSGLVMIRIGKVILNRT